MHADDAVSLDELLSSCRAEHSRRALGEAVACLRAGAYRAAIVATWTAVVYDYLSKLRELELAGDTRAKEMLAKFETARATEDKATLLTLERTVLEQAVSFELLSPIEDRAVEVLRASLPRARVTLIRRLLVELIRRVIAPAEAPEHNRLYAALQAVTQIRHADVQTFLEEKLASVVNVPDVHLHWLVAFSSRYDLAWPHLGPANQGRLVAFVLQTDEADHLTAALACQGLTKHVVGRLPQVPEKLLHRMCRSKLSACLDEVTRRFECSQRWATFRDLRPALDDKELKPLWTQGHVARLLAAMTTNAVLQTYDAFPAVARSVLKLRLPTSEGDAAWRLVYERVCDMATYPDVAREFREALPSLGEHPVSDA